MGIALTRRAGARDELRIDGDTKATMIIKYLLTITLLLPALPVTCLRAGESPSSELFPKGVSAREWATFAAGGFDESVTGVIYRDGTMLPGMPLGGFDLPPR